MISIPTHRIIYFCLIFSLTIHLLILVGFSLVRFRLAKKTPQVVEITYMTKPKSVPIIPIQQREKEVSLLKDKKTSPNLDILSKKNVAPTFLEGPNAGIEPSQENTKALKKETSKITSFNESRCVTVPLLRSEKITNPKYLSYNEAIRQKIRQRAFSFVDHPDFKQGEVYLTFILDRSGALKGLKIIDSKTHANNYLRDAGLKSVEQSSPFNPFPADLNYEELTFNVVISFQVDE
jgi:outer membrane biosynthesis protein TonB